MTTITETPKECKKCKSPKVRNYLGSLDGATIMITICMVCNATKLVPMGA